MTLPTRSKTEHLMPRPKKLGKNSDAVVKDGIPTNGTAVKLAAKGMAILPVYGARNGVCTCSRGSSCNKPGKHPIVKDWTNIATKDANQIVAWGHEHRFLNIGIATGAKSGILVIDVDPKNGGNESFTALCKELGELPITPTVLSGGGGQHFFFKYSAAIGKTRHGALGPGIDVQGDRAYVVAAPSMHVSGNRYKWETGRSLFDVELAEIPEPWAARLSETKSGSKLDVNHGTGGSGPSISEGGRNTALTSLAGKLKNTGLADEAILDALLAENALKCSPPLDNDEVRTIARSASKFVPHALVGDQAETLAHEVLQQHFQGGRTLIYASDGQMWSFKDTHWSPMAPKILDKIILDTIVARGTQRTGMTTSLIGQTRTLLETKSAKEGDVLRFTEEPPPVINTRGGELWVETDGSVDLRPHIPESYLRHCLDVEYDKAAQCPKYDAAIDTIFSGKSEMVQLWHELSGYIIQPGRLNALVVICKGEGSNGKTKLVETLTRLLGKAWVAAMPVADLEKSRFAIGSLIDKLLFVDDDVKSGTTLPDGQLKRISEAKTVTGEHKFGNPFTFIVRALPILLCNNPPALSDVTNGMVRRLLVIPFEHKFEGDAVDHKLFPDIWTNEMPGILNRAIDGLGRVMANNWKLSQPKPVTSATSQYINEANPVPGFVEAKCVKGKHCQLELLYNAFTKWCDASGIRLTPRAKFKQALVSRGYGSRKTNKGIMILGLVLAE